MFSLGVIVTVVLFGGLMAFLGDRIGMKVGKKRLTVFGLRPKYTSILITILTGFVIAGLTLASLMGISEEVRTAVFKLESLQQDLASTTSKAHRLGLEVSRKENQLRKQEAELQKQEKELEGLNKKYKELENQLKDVLAARILVEKQLATVQLQFDGAVAQLAETKQNLGDAKKELAQTQSRIDNLVKTNDELKKQNVALNAQEARLNQAISNLNTEMRILEAMNQGIKSRPMLFAVGDIIVTRIANPSPSKEKAQADTIDPLIKTANDLAFRRGARIPGAIDQGLQVSQQRINEVCEQLAIIKTNAVIRIIADRNSIPGEPAGATIEIYPNELIFKNGEVIVETEVLGESAETAVLDRLTNLVLRANAKAIEKGIYTGEQNLRNLTSVAELTKIINRVKFYRQGRVRIKLMAATDIYRVDPFKVRFEVVPIK
jgi:uncharacterized protein (DUF3084 family)